MKKIIYWILRITLAFIIIFLIAPTIKYFYTTYHIMAYIVLFSVIAFVIFLSMKENKKQDQNKEEENEKV